VTSPTGHNFKETRNLVKKMLREAERKRTYDEVRLLKNNSRSLWKIINRAIASKEKQNQTYANDLTANKFNQFFSNVSRKAADASLHLADKNNITLREPSLEVDDIWI